MKKIDFNKSVSVRTGRLLQKLNIETWEEVAAIPPIAWEHIRGSGVTVVAEITRCLAEVGLTFASKTFPQNMTMRDDIANRCIVPFASRAAWHGGEYSSGSTPTDIARRAYEIADAMLEARERKE